MTVTVNYLLSNVGGCFPSIGTFKGVSAYTSVQGESMQPLGDFIYNGAEQAIIGAFDGAITQMLGGIAANAQMKLAKDRRRMAQQLGVA